MNKVIALSTKQPTFNFNSSEQTTELPVQSVPDIDNDNDAEYDAIISANIKDFFDITKFGEIRIRSIQQFLAGPFFSDERVCKEIREIKNENGEVILKIIPSNDGCPTSYDKDLITYTISHLVQMLDDKKIDPRAERAPIVKINGIKMCETIDRPIKTGRISDSPKDKVWKQWHTCGRKLMGSFVETNSYLFGGEKINMQHFLQTYRMSHFKGGDKFIIEVRIEDWIWNAVRAGYLENGTAEILSLDRDYYKINHGLERRMYEILKKFLNNVKNNSRAKFEVSLIELKAICGNRTADNEFKKDIEALIRKYNHRFRDWHINIMSGTHFRAVNMKWVKEVNSSNNESEQKKFTEQMLA